MHCKIVTNFITNKKTMSHKFNSLLATLLITASSFAQAPAKMSYQAVVKDASSVLVTNQVVGMQISILQTTETGTAVYVETQTPTTNSSGVLSIEIGGTAATVVSGSLSTIDWAAGPYYIKTETDPTGGTSYTITGTSQFRSVPYTAYAVTTATAASAASATSTATATTTSFINANYNCSSYIIPYMPYSPTKTQSIFISNPPGYWYTDDTSSQTHDINVEAVDDDGISYDLGIVATVFYGRVKDMSTLIKNALTDQGFDGTGKVALRIYSTSTFNSTPSFIVNASYTNSLSGGNRVAAFTECVR